MFLFFVFNGDHAQAQTPDEINSFENAYFRYLNLFTNDSGLTHKSFEKNTENNKFNGILFDIQINLNTEIDTAENLWKYVDEDYSVINSNSGDEVFVIRLCDNENKNNCWINTVLNQPFGPDPITGTNYTHNHGVIYRKALSGGNTNFFEKQKLINLLTFNTEESKKPARGDLFTFKKGSGNNGELSSFNDIDFKNLDSVEASLWYCAENSLGVDSKSIYSGTSFSDRIGKFDDLCDGYTFFKIGNSINISIPDEGTYTPPVLDERTPGSERDIQEPSENNLPVCDISLAGNSKVIGCIARIVYYGFYIPTSWLAGLFGMIFDFFIGYSVDDASYRYDFVVKGWRIVRDISNIAFIIILLYTGIKAVFNTGGSAGSDMRRIVPNLIINALIINFSLFATRTVIDASNIGTRVFYSRMIVCDGECINTGSGIPANIKRGLGGYWPLSEKITSTFDPQKLFSPSILSPEGQKTNTSEDLFRSTGGGRTIRDGANNPGFNKNSDEYAGYYTLVSLLSGLIMLAIAVMFFKTAFLFVGRVVGLYVLMIFSPIAFLTRSMGKTFNIKKFNWTEWLKELTSYALLAPIFTFFLYIIYSFFESGLVKQMGLKEQGESFFEILISIVLPMLVIFMLIKYAQKIAEEHSGEIGKMVQSFAEKTIGGVGVVAGGAVGLAAGGAALLGTRLGSRVVGRLANKAGLTDWAAENASTNRFARSLNSGIRSTQTGSWDVRNTWLGKNTGAGINSMINMTNRAGLTNIDNIRDNISGRLGLGAKDFAGGAIALQKKADERREKALNKKFNDNSFAHLTDEQAKEVWVKIKEEKTKTQLSGTEEKLIDKHIDSTLKTNNTYYQKAIENIEFQKEQAKILENAITKSLEQLKDNNLDINTRKTIENQMSFNVNELQKSKNELERLEKVRGNIFDTRKNNSTYVSDIKNSKEFKDEFEKEKKNIEKDIDKKYGEVKKTKDLVMAAKMDYMNNQRENSMWMKDQKQRFQVVGGSTPYLGTSSGVSALSAALAGSTALASIGGGLAVGGVITSLIKEKVQATDNATKKIIKDLEKQIAKKDSLPKSEADLKNINEKIKNLLGEDIDLMSEETIREKMKLITEDLQANLDIAQINFEKAKKEYMSGSGRVSNDDIKNLSKDQQRSRDQVNESSDLLKRRKTLQAQIEKAEGIKNTDSKPKENSDDKSK